MPHTNSVKDPELERQGRRLGKPGWYLVAIGLLAAVPGAVLVAIDQGWTFVAGLALLALASCPFVVGIGLLLASAVPRWAARHKLFA
jgi:uncharacterized membrane protein YhhN